MKKWGFALVFIFVLAIGFVSAAENGTAIENGYKCLEDQIAKKSSLSLQEAFFSALALGSKSKASDKIEAEKGANCWPKAGCTLKETALGLLAYERLGKDTGKIEEWLLSKNSSAAELIWYLEIDISRKTSSSCIVKYTGNERNITIGSDMKITGNPGNCLSVSESGYWLRIKDSCYGERFSVSCNEDFVTTLIYQKKSGSTIYVSSTTHSSASSGTTEEQVSAQCFKTGTSCDYEGSLWASVALQKANTEVSSFVPYLIALASDNEKYLPNAFLYILTGGDDQYSELVQNQKQSKFWEAPASPNGKFYDTSLAMLALQGTSSNELNDAKSYLLSIQGKDGCWNNDNVRDTAFILYSGWVEDANVIIEPGASTLCKEAGYSCENLVECKNAGGNVLDNFECTGFGEFCCSVKVQEQTCSQKNGEICKSNEECDGAIESSADGSCCLGACREIQQTEDTCTVAGKFCSNTCNEDEQQSFETCSVPGQICCEPKPKESGNMTLWIIILVIAILLVLLGILFRNKLRIWIFRFRNKVKTNEVPRPPRPPFGQPLAQRPMPRFMPRTAQAQRPVQRPVGGKPASQTDKELEETLKKLKEMSK